MLSVPVKTVRSRSQDGNFQLLVTGWYADYPDPITFLGMFTTGGSYNYGQWSNKQYDALIKRSQTTDATNEKRRYADMLQAQELLTKQQAVIPLYQVVTSHLVNKAANGIQYGRDGLYNYVGATLK